MRDAHKDEAKTTGQPELAITAGVFDLLHEGHLELFAFMGDRANNLHILVHDDESTLANKGRIPVQDTRQRARNVRLALLHLHIPGVVEVVKSADPSDHLKRVLARRGNKIYVRGDDWKDFPGKGAIEGAGVEIFFKPYTEGVSSTERRKALVSV